MRPIKRAIILCWIMLVACFAIKLFGGNWFEVVCTNEHFSKLCEFVDNNWFLYYPIGLSLYVASTIFVVLSVSNYKKFSKKDFLILILVLILLWSTQFISSNTKFIADTLFLIFSPLVIHLIQEKNIKNVIKNNWYKGIFCFLITFIFQIISLVTKNVGIKITDDSTLVTLILLIDYYIMIVLYYLYMKKSKEVKNG